MLGRLKHLVALGMLLLASTGVHAGTLTNATWFQTGQGLPLTRTFTQLGATGTSTASSVAVTLSYPFLSTHFFVPATLNGTLDLAVTITQGGAQALSATAGMAGGTPGIPGTVILLTAAHVGMGANQSMFMVGLNTLVAVPLSNGKGGQFTGTFTIVNALHRMTVDFYAWTPGTLTFTGLTSLGTALPTVVAMGSFALTPNGGGTVTLVSPSKVSIDGPVTRRTASFTRLVLTFVPEPGAALLLVASALALALGARRLRG